MIRPAIVLLLLLSAALMMRGLAGDWRNNLSISAQDAAKKSAPAGEAATVAPLPQVKVLQPEVPAVLPDLKAGYLFNQERMLAGADIPPAAAGGEEAAGDITSGITASVDEVVYTGSIITDAHSVAIVSYPSPVKNMGRQPAGARFPKGGMTAAGPEEYARLAVGDVLDGYEVKEILADKLILTRGEETVEKLLYDPEKNRQTPPPRPKQAPSDVSATPPAGTPAPGGVKVGIPPAPGGTPVPAQGVHTPPNPNAGGGVPTRPIRRMAIPRRSTAGPDISRETRQLQDEGGTIPLPPGEGQ